MSETPLLESALPLPLLHRGKVRDVYAVGDDRLLMVASDRVSAFDVVLPQPIPRKGEVLTQITGWWLDRLERDEGIRHHLLAVDPDQVVELEPSLAGSRSAWTGRGMLVRRTTPILVECVIRGYLAGSAWREYRDHGTLAGEALPGGLRQSQVLPKPLFSPATKAQEGHDENIPVARVRELLGDALADRLEERSRRVYAYGRRVAEDVGILLADTKFEFGQTEDGTLLLIDEVLTPDSSRFWPAESYAVGRSQPSLDKQPIRDWLDALPDWDKTPPPPDLPDEVVDAASRRYREVFRRLTGSDLDAYRPPRFTAED
ncbi:MAG TPA: phosphoribosylaminoimidazolesuccinocarboxamide synthase [Longimicrobiales bacterium]|nr:phosphoribosylaminoimidazolesuccinocarboxamide synthase [Longimicrobiales bacterium]